MGLVAAAKSTLRNAAAPLRRNKQVKTMADTELKQKDVNLETPVGRHGNSVAQNVWDWSTYILKSLTFSSLMSMNNMVSVVWDQQQPIYNTFKPHRSALL